MWPIRIGAVAVTAAIVVGCGNSGNSLSRTEMATKANAVCKRMIEQRRSLNFSSQRELMLNLPRLTAYEQTGFAELGKLAPPRELAKDWKLFVEGGQTLINDTVEYSRYVAVYNRRSARIAFHAAGAMLESMHEAAKRSGFAQCAQFA